MNTPTTSRPSPKMSLARGNNNTIVLIITNAYKSAIDDLTTKIGLKPMIGISNTRSITCHNPEELDAARNQLLPFFDNKGEWISK